MTDLLKKQYWHTLNLRRQTLMAALAAMRAGGVEPEILISWGRGVFEWSGTRYVFNRFNDGYENVMSPYLIIRVFKDDDYVLLIIDLPLTPPTIEFDDIPYTAENMVNGSLLKYIPEN